MNGIGVSQKIYGIFRYEKLLEWDFKKFFLNYKRKSYAYMKIKLFSVKLFPKIQQFYLNKLVWHVSDM